MSEPCPQLTEAEKADERQKSEALLQFLQAKLESLSLAQKQALHDELKETVESALRDLSKKLFRRTDLVLKNPQEEFRIKWGLHSTEDAFSSLDRATIEWGKSYFKSNTITLLKVISFAPKEIIREVVVHEVMHLLYPRVETGSLGQSLPPAHLLSAVSEYPKDRQTEELWVREMVLRLGFDERRITFWELAVEQRGDNWRPLYYKLKKEQKRP